MKRLAIAVLIATLALGTTATTAIARPDLGKRAAITTPVTVQWLRVDPWHPRTLYASGYEYCYVLDYTTSACPKWLMRSTDGGATWADLSDPFVPATDDHPGPIGDYTLQPMVIAPNGRHLYLSADQWGFPPGSLGVGYYASRDGGLHWQGSASNDGGYGGGISGLAVSPVSSTHVYAIDSSNAYAGRLPTVKVSDDGAATWTDGGAPGPVLGGYPGDIVPEPTYLDTVYANIYNAGTGRALGAVRSGDDGLTWDQVTTPTASPPLQTFAVSTDPVEGPLLIGQTQDITVPADRRYLSDDEGRTWSVTTCPGDLHGQCPSLMVSKVFGAGANYAFIGDGIWRFHGGGPAEMRLGISRHLPVSTERIAYVGAGRHAGDPVYLLATSGDDLAPDNTHSSGPTWSILYRSTDAGKSWQSLPIGVLPAMAMAGKARGTLYVRATRHSVGAPFVATYRLLRRFGPDAMGPPLTEAYWEGNVLTQVFTNMRFEQHGKRIVTIDADGLAWLRARGWAAPAP